MPLRGADEANEDDESGSGALQQDVRAAGLPLPTRQTHQQPQAGQRVEQILLPVPGILTFCINDMNN